MKSVIFFDFPTFSWISLRNIFFYVNFLSEKRVKSKKIVLFLIKINRMISHIKSCFSPVFLDFRDSHYVAAVENDGGFNDLNNLVWKIVISIFIVFTAMVWCKMKVISALVTLNAFKLVKTCYYHALYISDNIFYSVLSNMPIKKRLQNCGVICVWVTRIAPNFHKLIVTLLWKIGTPSFDTR